MSHSPSLLVADIAFVEPSVARERKLLSVFPMRKGDGAYRATLDQLLERSRLQSAFYSKALPGIAAVFHEIVGLPVKAIETVVRAELVTVTSLFVDRYLRVAHRLRQIDGEVTVASVTPIGDVQWSSQLRSTSSTNWQLNQEIIWRISSGLGCGEIPLFDAGSYPEYPVQQGVLNTLFLPAHDACSQLFHRIVARGYSLLGRLPNPKVRVLSTGLVYDEHYLNCSGFFGPFGTLRRCANVPGLRGGVRNLHLRKQLRERLQLPVGQSICALLETLDPFLDRACTEHMRDTWLDMLVDWYPTSLLEALQENLESVRASLDLSRVNAIIGAELTSDVGTLQCLSARLAGKEVIGVQHTAGHYGYIEDMSVVAHPEYALYDTLVTFGWNRIDEHLPQCRTIPLPCPKLSAKPLASNYLEAATGGATGQHDILFLSNVFHRFPHISTCGQARVDFVDQILDSQLTLIEVLTESGLTVDHKPYNTRCLDLYPAHYAALQEAGGSSYRTVATAQKGLTVGLIKTCRIVLWDQLGSGAVECLTAGIPTIVFWQRIYSREVSWAKGLIGELERCGIVHSRPDTLAAEIRSYLADPMRWMRDEPRVGAIKAFCRQFAWTEPDWQKYWTRQLRQLPMATAD
jgi:hypothetical protein